jgi:hypothetical protein
VNLGKAPNKAKNKNVDNYAIEEEKVEMADNESFNNNKQIEIMLQKEDESLQSKVFGN